MKYIKKNINNQPLSLMQHKNRPNHNYNNYLEKDELRKALVVEQNYICCYCMRRIQSATSNKMKIEHFMPHSIYNGENGKPDLTLDYNNLLASCKGGEGGPKNLYHCDKSKTSSEIELNPTNETLMQKIKFTKNGIVFTGERKFDNEIDEVLRLNIQSLKNARKKIIEGLEQAIKKKFGSGSVTKSFINEKMKLWTRKNPLGMSEEYCQVAILYLEKKLKKTIN